MDSTKNVSISDGTNYLTWSHEFEVAEEKINEQHKQIVNIINELIAACNNGESKNMLGKALGFLADYVVMHFGYEEYIMDEYDLPYVEQHKRLHEEFKQTAGELIKSYETNGASESLSEALKNIVIAWLITHIKEEDVDTFASLV